MIRQLTLAKKIAQFALLKKAQDVTILNVKRFTIIAEYFVIMTANSEPHRQTLTEEITKKVKQNHKIIPLHIDGKTTPNWTVLDYGGVMVHIFSKNAREVYNLEKLYYGAKKLKYKE